MRSRIPLPTSTLKSLSDFPHSLPSRPFSRPSFPWLPKPSLPSNPLLASRFLFPARPFSASRRQRGRGGLYGSRVAAGRGAGGWRAWRQRWEAGRQAGRRSRRRVAAAVLGSEGGREWVTERVWGREGASGRASSSRRSPAAPARPRRRPAAQRRGRAEPSWVGPGPCCSPCTVCGGTSPRWPFPSRSTQTSSCTTSARCASSSPASPQRRARYAGQRAESPSGANPPASGSHALPLLRVRIWGWREQDGLSQPAPASGRELESLTAPTHAERGVGCHGRERRTWPQTHPLQPKGRVDSWAARPTFWLSGLFSLNNPSFGVVWTYVHYEQP